MTTALMLIDLQNGFLAPHGSGARRASLIPRPDELVNNNRQLIVAARSAEVPVVYTRHQYRLDALDMPPAVRARYSGDELPLTAGSWDAAIVDELWPEDGDAVISKNRYDAFLYADTEVVLRALGATQLVVTGVLTNMCVESTVRSAEQRGFDVTVVSDCVAATDQDLHRASLASMAASFASVVPRESVVASWLANTIRPSAEGRAG